MYNTKETNKKTTKQQLLHTYISIIKDHNKGFSLSYNAYIKYLKEYFNFNVTHKDLELYFQPNIDEDNLDLKLQLLNLGVSYD